MVNNHSSYVPEDRVDLVTNGGRFTSLKLPKYPKWGAHPPGKDTNPRSKNQDLCRHVAPYSAWDVDTLQCSISALFALYHINLDDLWNVPIEQKKWPWLSMVCMGWNPTQICGDYFINQEMRIPTKQLGYTRIQCKVSFFCVAQFMDPFVGRLCCIASLPWTTIFRGGGVICWF